MSPFNGKTFWIVGASEGLGRELAKQLAQAGAFLILSARNKERLEELRTEISGAKAIAFDVTNADECRQAAAQVDAMDAALDGVIYNAGAYTPMAAQSFDTEAALSMIDVNTNGAIRVLGEVLPGFLDRGKGDITLVGSLAGYRGLPKSIGYSASKAALISLAESLKFDLKGTGVTIRIVNPGFIETRLTAKNAFKMPMLMTPETAARHVMKAMQKRRFRTDFPAPFSWAIRLIRALPDWIVYRGR